MRLGMQLSGRVHGQHFEALGLIPSTKKMDSCKNDLAGHFQWHYLKKLNMEE